MILKNKNSIAPAIKTIDNFSQISGLYLNLDKTFGIWLGIDRNNEKKCNGITFPEEPIKCLGIYIGHNKTECENLNWEPKIKEIDKLFESWKTRKLTLIGKTQIINSLAISTFVYNFTLLIVPDNVIKKLNTLIFKFLWKKEGVKRSVVINKRSNGGLNVIDIDSKIKSLKASWIPRLLKTKSSWKNIPSEYIKNMGFEIKDFIKINSLKNTNIFKNQPFFKEIVDAFNNCKDKENTNYKFSDVLWLNEKYKWKDKVIFFKSWAKSGFIYVKDFLSNRGFKSEQLILEKLKDKRNWIQEFMIIKKTIRNAFKNQELENSVYTNIKHKYTLIVNGKHEGILDKNKKASRTYLEPQYISTNDEH